MKTFGARWSPSLVIISLIATAILLAVGVTIVGRTPRQPWSIVAGILPLLLLGGCALLFTVRGYSIEPNAILVHRLLWSTRLPRSGIQSVALDPKAMSWSIRTFGNGGLFSFSGFFRNSRLGSYRAYVTDLGRTVVLRYSTRTVVLSPDPPEEFVRELVSPIHA